MWVGGWVQSQSGAGDGDQNCFTGDWSSQSPKTYACKNRSNDWSQKVEAILELEGKLIPLRKVSDVGFCKTADFFMFQRFFSFNFLSLSCRTILVFVWWPY